MKRFAVFSMLLSAACFAAQHPIINAGSNPTTAPVAATQLNEDIAELYTYSTAGAVRTNASNVAILRDTLSLNDYVNNPPSSTYVPARWSESLAYTLGNVSTTTGSAVINCTTGCNWTSADVGDAIVVLVEYSTNTFRSTIASVQSATQVTLAATVPFTTTTGFAYMGTDSTTQINAAMSAAIAANRCVYVPDGGYFYAGSGSSGWLSPCIVGDNNNKSLIFLAPGSYLIDDNNYWLSGYSARVGYYGGAGVFRNRFTSGDVTLAPFVWENNDFRDYSAAAISINSPDMPYQFVVGNTFQGQNTITSIGYANAAAGPSWVDKNAFIADRVHVKLGSGYSVKLTNNDFIQFYTDPSNVRAAVWIVPGSSATQDPTYGASLMSNKFGNENLATQDLRVLFADTVASSGSSYFGETLWQTTASAGNIGPLVFGVDNLFLGGTTTGTGGVNPIIYSYTPNVRQVQVGGNLGGTYPGYAIQFDASVTPVNNGVNHSNICGPFLQQGFGINPLLMSNLPGYCISNDLTGDMGYADPLALTPFMTGSGPASRKNLSTVAFTSWSVVGGGGSLATIQGPDHIANAVTWTMGSAGAANNFGRGLSVTPNYGVQSWMEFDLEHGSTGTPISSIEFAITDSVSSLRLASKTISSIPATWQHYKIPMVLALAPTNTPPRIAIFSTSTAAVGQTVDIANVHFYQATEPVGGGLFDNPVRSPGLISSAENGNAATVTGCSNTTPTTPGASSGGFVSGVTGTCTVTITMGMTAPNDLYCHAYDKTTPTDNILTTASSANSCTFSGTTVTGDVIKFLAVGH